MLPTPVTPEIIVWLLPYFLLNVIQVPDGKLSLRHGRRLISNFLGCECVNTPFEPEKMGENHHCIPHSCSFLRTRNKWCRLAKKIYPPCLCGMPRVLISYQSEYILLTLVWNEVIFEVICRNQYRSISGPDFPEQCFKKRIDNGLINPQKRQLHLF